MIKFNYVPFILAAVIGAEAGIVLALASARSVGTRTLHAHAGVRTRCVIGDAQRI